jgi:predicted transposase/invertase (TIGR01784 family)
MTPAEKKAYDRYMDNRGSLDCAFETAREDGWKEGIEEGMAKGMAKGRAEGLEAGKAQEQARMAVALHNKSVAIDIIAETTGFTMDEINKIIARNKN